MFLSKESMFKDGSFFLMLLQSGAMLHSRGISRVVDRVWIICLDLLKGLMLV